ncbi:hypothetical protein RIF29_38477 [Crotalaria pallida]|uniref:Uncharacterized protein n=1 Tax=Crotalaria pallida TaxID=3830 RepID=A0AAN9DZU0_CROPI
MDIHKLQNIFSSIGSKHGHGGLKLARVRILISVEGNAYLINFHDCELRDGTRASQPSSSNSNARCRR